MLNAVSEMFDAIRHDDAARVSKLIGRQPDLKNEELPLGQTWIHWAAGRGAVNVLAVLVKHGYGIDERSRGLQETPLHFAGSNCMIDAVSWLLERHADVNAVDRHGQTPLFFAAKCGGAEVVEKLLDAGADPNMRSNGAGPKTAIEAAFVNGHTGVVEMLHRRGGWQR